jgi:sigma-B regulation protein RsbU (phosphoserine phosphatase)
MCAHCRRCSTALCIADVSGKSVRAQARLPLLKYSLRALAPLYKEPEALVKRLNETLAPDLQSELFIGLCYVVLDPRRGQLRWCNAGHIAPLLISSRAPNAKQGDAPSPEITLLETNGPALGPFPEIGYSEEKLPWRPGDRLLMFTDGLSDALSYGGSEDGEEQIRLTSLAINPEYWSEPDSIAQRFVNLASAALEYTDTRLLNLAPLRRAGDAGSGFASGRRDDITVVAACYSESS